MRRLIAVFLFAASGLVFSPSFISLPVWGSPQRETNLTIKGNVYFVDESQPATNVSVQLTSSEGDMIAPESTTESGGFEFHGLSHGSYSIYIDVQGYEKVSYPVDLSFTSARGLVIYLRPSKKGKAASKTGSSISTHELGMPEKARDLVDSGKKKLADKNAQGALEDFQAAVAAAPGYYEAYYQMAMVEVSLGKGEDAEKDFHKSIEVSGDKYGEAEVGLGALMLNRGDNAGGEKAIRRGVELNPNDWLGHYELGRALLNQNETSEAYKSAEQARALAPNVANIYRLLSDIHWKARNYPALLEDLDAYIKLDPNSAMGEHAKELREKVAALAASMTTPEPESPHP
jgi:hypothetical protein